LRESPWVFVVGFCALLAARLLSAPIVSFIGLDEISLAAGVSALVGHNELSDTYRYGPQVGYHRLIQLLVGLTGGSARNIPLLMTFVSAASAAIIPLCGLALFPAALSRVERWVLAGLLAINPILWMSARYGNSTSPATALLVLAVTILSTRPARRWEAIGLACFGLGVIVRADTILAAPAIGLLLWQRYARIAPVAVRVVPVGAAVAVVFAGFFLWDPRMADSVRGVADHLASPSLTKFWEYLLWSTGPVAFVFAIVGMTEMARERRELLWIAAAWCAPFFVFYYSATTTPRYFVPTVVPIAIASAIGALALGPLLAPQRARLASILLGGLAMAPLFVGLSWYSPNSWMNRVRDATFPTQIGPMWTGAFLYKSYRYAPAMVRAVTTSGFGRTNPTERAIDSSFAAVKSGASRGHTVIIILDGWSGHMTHFFANAYGARYRSKAPGPMFTTETWMELGGAQLMSISRGSPGYQALSALPLRQDDQLWLYAVTAESDVEIRALVPPGLELRVVSRADAPVRQYVANARVAIASPATGEARP
jgi:hypothetical protein